MRKRVSFRGFMVSMVAMVLTLQPAVAAAFSGYGAGTSGNPYRIGTCAQLQEISSALSSYYVLVRNIDCSGSTFTHLGTFTGTLDGQNHTISNLTIDSDGLFTHVNGGTVKNITIASGTVIGSGYLGSFAARATNATFSNIHSAMTVSAPSGAYGGGLVGSLSGTTSVTKSSFSGTLNSDAYSGGIVGAMWDAGVSLTDSFVSGSVVADSVYVGAAVGAIFNGTVNRIYSSAAFNAAGHGSTSGLVGVNQTTLSNSFAATTITNPSGTTRGMIGLHASGTYTNNYFDATLAGTSTCGNSGGGCTAANVSNVAPNYFKNNTTNGPFSAWDFTNVWATTSSYPTLRVLSDFTATAGIPNSGDANGDGIQDTYQPGVASVANSNDVWSTIELASGSGCVVESPLAYDAASIKIDNGYASPLATMTAFDLYCAAPGASATVTIIYDTLYDTSAAVLRFYNPATSSYSTVSGATFGARPVGGSQKTTVTYTVTDGESYDTDATADGIIHDPVGFASVVASTPGVPNTGLAPRATFLPVLAVSLGGVLLAGASYAQKKRQ